jgi:hypothetical protein
MSEQCSAENFFPGYYLLLKLFHSEPAEPPAEASPLDQFRESPSATQQPAAPARRVGSA